MSDLAADCRRSLQLGQLRRIAATECVGRQTAQRLQQRGVHLLNDAWRRPGCSSSTRALRSSSWRWRAIWPTIAARIGSRMRLAAHFVVAEEQCQNAAGTIDDRSERGIGNVAIFCRANQNGGEGLRRRHVAALAERKSKLELNDRVGVGHSETTFVAECRRLIEHRLRKPHRMAADLRMRIAESLEGGRLR